MKKTFLTAAVMLMALGASAQLLEVGTPVQVEGLTGESVAISADGSFVVASNILGLQRADLADGRITRLASGDDLYGVRIAADGSQVIYQRPSYDKKHLRKVALEAVPTDGSMAVKTIVKPTRKLAGATFAGSTVNAVASGKRQAKALNGSKTVKAPVASINYGHLDITDADGHTATIDPLGRGSYIWESISPDGTRVLAWMIGRGCFTCDLDGSNVKMHGPLRAAVWAGDHMLIGMDEVETPDQNVKGSAITALDVNTGATQRLTGDEFIARYPAVSADGSRLAFVNADGKIYTMDLKRLAK